MPIICLIEENFADETKVVGDRFHLSIDDDDWDQLEESFKDEKRPWFKGFLKVEDRANWPVKVKARGMNYWHWAGVKKSIWLNLVGDKTIDGWKRVSLVNIKWEHYILDFYAYDMAKKIDLMAPNHKLSHLYINKIYNGLYHQIEDFDKYYLLKNDKKLGEIYYYDVYKYLVGDFYNTLFWRKRANISGHTKDDKRNIKELLGCLAAYCEDAQKYLRVEKFIDNKIIFELLGSSHLDTSHNHRLYFNPETKKFEPIMWDLARSEEDLEYDQSFNLISQNLFVDPKVRANKLRRQYYLLSNVFTEQFIEEYLNSFIEKYKHNLLFDKKMGSYDAITYYQFIQASFATRDIILKRRKEMLEISTNPPKFTYKKLGRSKYRIYFNTPHVLAIKSLEGKFSKDRYLRFKNRSVSLKDKKQTVKVAANWVFNKTTKKSWDGSKIVEDPSLIKNFSYFDVESTGAMDLKAVVIENQITKTKQVIWLKEIENRKDASYARLVEAKI